MERSSDSRPRPLPRNRFARTVALTALVLAGGLAGAVFAEGPIEEGLTAPPAGPREPTGSFWANPETVDDPIDVQFTDLDVEQAVRFLTGEMTNVVAPAAVRRPVSLNLREVRTAQALDWLLQSEAIAARFDGNAVFLSDRERRTYRLPLVLAESSPVWNDIESGLQTIGSISDGIFVLNKAAGVLTAEDTPANLDRAESHLHRVLVSVLRQVEIEVKILEAVYDQDRGLGIDWTVMNGVLDPDWSFTGGTPGGNLASQGIADQHELFQIGILQPGKFRMFLDAFEENIELNMISRPRITMMSNQPSKFKVKERIPFLTKTISQEGGVPITDFELQFDEAGIDLEVTASIGEDGVITMDVHPIISTVVGFTQSLPDLGPQPIIDTRETRSVVRMQENSSLVMGGLMQDRENVTIRGVPYLSSIPVLGRLFRAEEVRHEKTEVLIVLTPRIREEPAVGSLATHDRIRTAGFVPGDAGVPSALAGTRTDQAWVGLVSGNPTVALSLAESAARVRPDAWWTMNNLGLAYREVGWLARAETTLRQAVVATEPARPIPLTNLGVLLLHRGKLNEAASVLGEAASRAPYGVVRDEAVMAWALALELSGRRGEALAALEQAGGEAGRMGDRVLPRRTRILTSMEQVSVGS